MFIVQLLADQRTLHAGFLVSTGKSLSEKTQELMNDFGHAQLPRLRRLATGIQEDRSQSVEDQLRHAFASGADAVVHGF